MDQNAAKRAAAVAAVAMVESDMVLGLGTGSTAALFVEELIARVARDKLKIVGIPTSERTAAQAKAGGIEIIGFADRQRIDVTFDGADTIDLESFALLKGLGGALLREKIVAEASDRLVIIADESKIASPFGGIVPVEIVRFGMEVTQKRLTIIAPGKLRLAEGKPYVTDNGNYIVDLDMPSIGDADALQEVLKSVAGIVETGLFIGQAETIIVAGTAGAVVHQRQR